MKRLFGILLVSASIVLHACTVSPSPQTVVETVGQKSDTVGEKVSVDGGSYTDISVSELQAMLEKKDFTFVNVHIPFEGDIAQTDLSIAYDKIDQNLDKLPPDKNAKIVLYCRSGRMSAIAAETLVGLGFTNVWNLSGGMVAWEQAGLEIVR